MVFKSMHWKEKVQGEDRVCERRGALVRGKILNTGCQVVRTFKGDFGLKRRRWCRKWKILFLEEISLRKRQFQTSVKVSKGRCGILAKSRFVIRIDERV